MLSVVPGEDLATLLTCTPYGVNSHRMLVRGHRVPYEPEAVEETVPSVLGVPSLRTNYLLWVFVGLATTGVFILALYLIDRRKRKRAGTASVKISGGDSAESCRKAERELEVLDLDTDTGKMSALESPEDKKS